MSVSSGLDVEFVDKTNTCDLINDLISIGWVPDDNGNVSFLPMDDDDQYNWEDRGKEELDIVLSEIKEKFTKGEVIGIVLTWKDTMIGGEFIFYEDRKSFSMSITINRRKIGDSICTNFSWYEDRIIEPIKNYGYKILKAEFSEYN